MNIVQEPIMGHPTTLANTTAAFPDALAPIQNLTTRLSRARNRGELGEILAEELQRYSIHDLQVIGGRLHADIEKLPSPYRERIRPYFIEQLFGEHHTLLSMHRTHAFRKMREPIRDPETFRKFCEMVPEGCFAWDDWTERNPYFDNPHYRLFYYLIAAFTIFVLERPGHPVGMPFPGGFSVEDRNGTFYCLIRDREKEVFYSICNFCPALQTEENAPVDAKSPN